MIATQHAIPPPSPLEIPSSAILPSSVPENAPEHCPVSSFAETEKNKLTNRE
jgi:hypothetical protein